MSPPALLPADAAPAACANQAIACPADLAEKAKPWIRTEGADQEGTAQQSALVAGAVAFAQGNRAAAADFCAALADGYSSAGLNERFYCLLALRLREAGLLSEGAADSVPLKLLLKRVGPWLLYALALVESDRSDEHACRHWLQQIADDGTSRGWRTWRRFRDVGRELGLAMYVFTRLSREFWTGKFPTSSSHDTAAQVPGAESIAPSRRPREAALMAALSSLLALPPGHARVADERVRVLWQRLYGNGLHEALLGLSRFCREHGYSLSDREFSKLLKLVRERGSPDEMAQAVADVQHAMVAPDALLVQDLLCVLRQLRRAPEATRLFEDARQRGLALNRYHYTSIVALCADCGDADGAQRYYTQMEQAGIAVDVCLQTALIHAYGKAGRYDAAQQFFDQQLRANKVVDKALCGALIDVLGRAGLGRRSAEVFSQMQRTGMQATHGEYGSLLWAYSRSGAAQPAQALFDKMTQDGMQPSAAHYGALLKAYLRAGSPVRAEELRDTMRQRGVWLEPCTSGLLIHAYGKAGLAVHAQRIFDEVVRSGCKPGAMEYGALIYAYSKCRRPDQAQRVFDDLVACGMTPNQRHYGALLDAYAQVGQLSRAEPILEQMQAQGLKAGAIEYGALLGGYCRAGRLSDAERIFAKMQQDGVPANSVHYNALISAYRSAQQFQKADKLKLQMQEGLA